MMENNNVIYYSQPKFTTKVSYKLHKIKLRKFINFGSLNLIDECITSQVMKMR